MIEKMKKITFLVYHREYDEFLHRLQELGVMHVEGGTLAEGQSEAVTADMAEIRRVDSLLKQMENISVDKKSSETASEDRDTDTLGRVRPCRRAPSDGCRRMRDALLHCTHQGFQEGDRA